MSGLLILNNWEYALSVDDQGRLTDSSKNRNRNGQEGWVIEVSSGRNVFLRRYKQPNNMFLSIDDDGKVNTSKDKKIGGPEEFEQVFHPTSGLYTFQRVKEPRYFLSQDNHGYIFASEKAQLDKWEGFHIL